MLHKEHTREQVSQQEGLSAFKLGMVWTGFPFIIAITISGSLFAIKSDLITATAAILLGSVLMFFYVGFLGQIGWKERRSFSQIAQTIFGEFGYVLIAGLLSVLVLGWFTLNTAMPAEIFSASFHVQYWLVAIVLGILFVAVAARGIMGMNMISNFSVPLFGVLIITAFAVLYSHSSGVAEQGLASVGSHTLTFQETLAGVLASFADSGTLAPDFNRWAVDRRASWISVFAAFPTGFGLAMLVGVAFTALLALHSIDFSDPFQTANPVGYLIGLGGIFAVFAVLVAMVNQGSNATHCLYNSILGFSKLSNLSYLLTTLVIGGIGVVIAATGVWAFLLYWLKIIGILVPPIGAVVILAYYGGYYAQRRDGGASSVTIVPWIALIFGWASGLIVNYTAMAPYVPVPIASFMVSAIVMGALVKVTRGAPMVTEVVLDEE